MEELKRKCPKCLAEISYKNVLGYKNAIKKESICRKCAASGQNNGMYGMCGVKNPFFGKKHTNEVINKIKSIDRSYTKTSEFKQKQSKNNSGVRNPMHGKSFYDVWVEKYGIDIANDKMINYKKKQSFNNTGVKNKMYGKPAPNGAGNGWSGWYNGWFFRSLRELTYMIKIIERFNLDWKTAETNNYKITYVDYDGLTKNYFPDFIVSNKYLVESKPKKLWNSNKVLRKKSAAIEFAKKHNLKYKIVDVGRLTDVEIKNLYDTGKIKFIDRYEKLYKTKISRND